MIKIKKRLGEFLSALALATKVNSETTFEFTKDKIRITAIDVSTCSMMQIEVGASLFEEYKIDTDVICTLNNEELFKVLKKLGKKEVQITFGDSVMTLSNSDNNFKLRYFVASKENRRMPDTTAKSKWLIRTELLMEEISDMLEFSEVICMMDNGKMVFRTRSTTIEGEICPTVKCLKTQNTISYYGGNYLSMITDLPKILKECTIEFGEDSPCKIEGEENDINFKFIVAPRVE